MPVIENGTYAVNTADVAAVVRGDSYAPPPLDRYYWLRVVLKSVGASAGQQWVFEDEAGRDEFYKKLVSAMGQ